MTPDETWRQRMEEILVHMEAFAKDSMGTRACRENVGSFAERLRAALPAPDRSEGAEWEPHPGQYVWIEGKLTDSQPDDFPKRKRVYVHGVGTGIAKTMKPIQEAAPDRSEGLRAALQKLRDDFAGAFKSTLILALTPQGRDAVKQALADANAALAATAQVTGAPSAEDLAESFHELYEKLAPSYGYATRPESAVPWKDIPERNKRLMVAVCDSLRKKWAARIPDDSKGTNDD